MDTCLSHESGVNSTASALDSPLGVVTARTDRQTASPDIAVAAIASATEIGQSHSNAATSRLAGVPGDQQGKVSETDILAAKILIVDDSESNVRLLDRLLRVSGYRTVDSTTDPTTVIERHRRNCYDLILLDLDMPHMDGFEVMQALHDVETFDYAPVLVITGRPDFNIRALQSGARDFISKPFERVELLTRIRNMVEVRLLHLQARVHEASLEQVVGERTAELANSEARFRSLTELSSDWYWEQDSKGRFTLIAGRALGLLDARIAGAVGKTPWEIPGSLWKSADRALLEADMAVGRPFHEFACGLFDADGQRLHFEISGEPVFDAAGRCMGYRGVGRDVTERMRRDEDLRRFRAAMNTTADAIFLLDQSLQRIVDVNHTACRLLGYSRNELLSLDPSELGLGMRDGLASMYQDAVSSITESAVVEVDLQRKDGTTLPVELSRRAQRSGDNWIVVGVARDITERREAERQMLRLAHFDTVTGLPNRTLFQHTLLATLERAEDNRSAVSVLVLDIDRLKNVNESLGHAAGDELLRQFSSRLVGCVRTRDLVGRLDGDTFAVILVGKNNHHGAGKVANTIRRALRRPFDLGGHEVTVTISIGISVCPSDASDVDTLLRNADAALHQAKGMGRDTYRFYTAEMNAQALQRMELEGALRKALARSEFVLHYQPKLDLESGRWVGVEALMRWNRPGHGLVHPAEFIPTLEETGLIVPVGAWAIEAACRQIAQWMEEGVQLIPVSVNVSGRQFQRANGDPGEMLQSGKDSCDLLKLESVAVAAMREYAIPEGVLEFELTESTLMAHAEDAVAILQRLQAAGIRISIDDFGTGYSSLAYLKRFSIDTVKIDREFVVDIASNCEDAAIAEAIINMAHSLRLRVVAEGVETQAQLDFLGAMGCDEVQGYFLARPLPGDEVSKLFVTTTRMEPVTHPTAAFA